MNLKNISDQFLLSEADRLTKNERKELTTILYHLKEIETRRLFSSLGYKSMFEYTIKELGYSEDQAMRRISAMRLLKELPEIETKITDGSLTLSNLGKAQSLFQKEKKMGAPLSPERKQQVINSIENKSSREADKIVLSHSSAPQTFHTEKVKQITPELSEIKFVADEQLLEKIEKLKGLLAHSYPQISMCELIHKLCDLGIAKWDLAQSPATSQKQRVKQPFKSKLTKVISNKLTTKELPSEATGLRSETSGLRSETTALNNKIRRAIPITIKREIWRQAESKCENCNSQYALEVDHIKPVALGGSNNRDNLRLLCRACNQRQAIEKLGPPKVQMHFG